MQCILELYLRGVYIKSEEVTIADHDDSLSFDDNCRIREVQMKAACETMKIQHVRALLKCENDYKIIAVLPSKIDQYEPERDLIGSEESH